MAAIASWPVVALIFGVICIIAFYKPITRLLDRANKIGPQGVEALSTAAQEKSSTREQTVEVISSQAEELLRLFDSKLLLEGEAAIRADLAKRNITSPGDRERALVRLLAGSAMFGIFERTYNLIFGSQIRVLQAINGGPLPKRDIEPFYAAAKSASPSVYSNYAFDQWLNFMISQKLIGVIDGNAVAITVRGREFLKYVIQEALPLNKHG